MEISTGSRCGNVRVLPAVHNFDVTKRRGDRISRNRRFRSYLGSCLGIAGVPRVRVIEFRVTGRRFSKLASWAHASLSREITRVKSSRDRSSVFSSPVELAFRCSTDARTLGKRSRCCLRGDRSLSVLYGHVFETRVSFSVDFI